MQTRCRGSVVARTVAGAIVAAALSVAVALPAAAQMQVRAAGEPLRVIDVKARVTDLDSDRTERYSVTPAQHVPLQVGDRVRVQIVGTVIRDGRGVEEVLPAEFRVVAGPWRIDLAPAGPDAVVVVARQPNEAVQGGAQAGSRSQVGYTVEGAGYEMTEMQRDGRITFDIAPAEMVTAPSSTDPRWRRAGEMADVLSHLLLDDRGELSEVYVERIYVNGYHGVQQVAETLARGAERQGSLRGWTDGQVVLHLYRHLLGREGTDREIYQSDPAGVQGNTELLQSRGYETLVESLVGSREFRDTHDVDRFQELAVDPAVDRSRHRGPLPEYGSLDDDERQGVGRTRPRGGGW